MILLSRARSGQRIFWELRLDQEVLHPLVRFRSGALSIYEKRSVDVFLLQRQLRVDPDFGAEQVPMLKMKHCIDRSVGVTS
jgi:hypothetical protein